MDDNTVTSALPNGAAGPSPEPNRPAGPSLEPSRSEGAGPAPGPGDFRASEVAPSSEQMMAAASVRGTGAPTPVAAPPQPQNFASKALGALGHMTMSLFGNDVQYQQDAQGNTIAVPVKQKPGDMFKHILAGALMGSALGSGSGGFTQGLSKGAAGAMEQGQQLDKEKYARAQQDAQNRREQQRMKLEEDRFSEEKTMHSAQVAQWNTTNLWHEQEMKFRNFEYLDKTNQQDMENQKWMVEHNAVLAPIPGNGTAGNGTKLMEEINKNPNLIKQGDKYDMLHLQRVDLSKLKWDEKQGWLDKETGKQADPGDYVTHYVYQVPHKTLDDQVTIPRAQFKSATGMDLPQGQSSTTIPFVNYLSLQHQHRAEGIQAAREDRMMRWDQARVVLDAAKSEISELQKQRSDVEGEIKSNSGQATAEQTKTVHDLSSSIRSAQQRYNKSLESIPGMPKLGEPIKEGGAGGADVHPDIKATAIGLFQQANADYKKASDQVDKAVRAGAISQADGEAVKKELLGYQQSEAQAQGGSAMRQPGTPASNPGAGFAPQPF